MTLTTVLPSGEWFGDVKILDSSKEAYSYTQNAQAHTAVHQIPDTAKELSSLYLNVEQGDVPDAANTKLRTFYSGNNGIDYSIINRSWESTSTALTYLVGQGMDGVSFPLEAQYVDSNGHTQIQSYDMTIERTPTLASLTVTADGTVLPVAFDPVTYTYDVVTVSDNVEITAEPFGGDYTVAGTDTVASSGSYTVTVGAHGKTASYTLNITKKNGYLYTYAGTTIYKVDTVSGAIVATGTMDHASSYAINPPTYADGMLFIGLADGTVQAFNAVTQESLWIYRDPLGGQPNCSIIYHDGYVYTGFWVGETSRANYVCLSATDEDP